MEIERVRHFYFSKSEDIYSREYVRKFGLDLDSLPKAVFNPIPKTVNMMRDLVCKKKIEIQSEAKEKDILLAFWKDIKLQKLKFEIVLHLLLFRRAFVELFKDEDNCFSVILHNPQSCISKGKHYFKIEGEIEEWDDKTASFVPVFVKKEYYCSSHARKIIITKNGKTEERILPFDFIPVAIFSSNYALDAMCEMTDDINQKRAWLKNIFRMHGNSLLTSKGRISTNSKINQNKGYKIVSVGEEGALDFVEMQGNIASLMREEIRDLQNNLLDEFPEYAISKMVQGSNLSTETMRMKGAEIVAKVESLRSALEEGIIELDSLFLQMNGKAEIPHSLNFGELFVADKVKDKSEVEKIRVEVIKGYLEIKNIDLLNKALARIGLEPVSQFEFAKMTAEI